MYAMYMMYHIEIYFSKKYILHRLSLITSLKMDFTKVIEYKCFPKGHYCYINTILKLKTLRYFQYLVQQYIIAKYSCINISYIKYIYKLYLIELCVRYVSHTA